jgi:hypothetical protein
METGLFAARSYFLASENTILPLTRISMPVFVIFHFNEYHLSGTNGSTAGLTKPPPLGL